MGIAASINYGAPRLIKPLKDHHVADRISLPMGLRLLVFCRVIAPERGLHAVKLDDDVARTREPFKTMHLPAPCQRAATVLSDRRRCPFDISRVGIGVFHFDMSNPIGFGHATS
jgi:hypothetical protein